MKNIQKGREPAALTQHRQGGGSFEDPGPWKQELRRALLREQGAICCYCMNRIELESLRIEHLRPQHEHRAQQLTHRNLLAACPGGQDNPTHEQRDIRHCDVRKGRARWRSTRWPASSTACATASSRAGSSAPTPRPTATSTRCSASTRRTSASCAVA
ncbi:TIGR02646 family protein [Nannocystis pusilla]|uniref:TIGR02646 family protein n=1 Tax=Nannocystis pusilla TaxID=889268 RepID=A0A9X3J2Z4_9BACT|nr:retron system putative HNH endonuclease [Nannocystis pusilla]MCY1012284.1 TIGR02646 family protein [Nannocystis pusilla]